MVGLSVHSLKIRSDQPHGVDLNDVSFEVHSGEILGIAGIAGNGQIELTGALSGEIGQPRSGSIEILGVDATRLDPIQRRMLGAVFVPEERIGQAAVANMMQCLVLLRMWFVNSTSEPPVSTHSQAVSRVAIYRSSLSAGRFCKNRGCWWFRNPPGVWMQAPQLPSMKSSNGLLPQVPRYS
jgi:ABC-type uncharacterized transport system ATPase subunit